MAKASTLRNMVSVLLVITAVSSASLGVMYQLTKAPKAAAEAAKQNFAIKAVLSGYDNEPAAEAYKTASFDGGDSLVCYPASKDGKPQGVAVRTWTTKGFSGLIRLMVGFDTEGNIINISVLEQRETPGLGSKMTGAEFKDQYSGKHPARNNLSVKKDGGEVDAITAATITSRAFSDAVNRAYKSLKFENETDH
ncbi:MAG: RnfABCDGE type electron transport complex subunit G [Bacteroidales bacterium]|jgi:electron transport complex protein RnfG|nr:RnfABCDGE type electron transport complex subunit G [Bacteroidales bacterium]